MGKRSSRFTMAVGTIAVGAIAVGVVLHSVHAASPPSPAATRGPKAVQGLQWPKVTVTSPASLPIGKEGVALTSHQGQLISVGGYTGSYSTSSVFEVLPTVRQIATLPQPTHDAAAGYAGDNLYIFGGGQATSYQTLVRVSRGTASTVATLPHPLSDASAVSWSEAGTHGILVVGGYDGSNFNRDARFYAENSAQQMVSHPAFTLPVGLRYAGVATDGQGVSIAGGLMPSGQLNSAVYRFVPNVGVKQIARLPVAVQKAAAFAWKSFVIVAGGYLQNGTPTNAIWAIHLPDGRTRLVGRLTTPLADMGYTQMGSFGYVLGGSSTQGMNAKLYRLAFH